MQMFQIKDLSFRNLKPCTSWRRTRRELGQNGGHRKGQPPEALLPGNGVRWGRLEPARGVGLVHGLVPRVRGRARGDRDRPHAQLLHEPRTKPAGVSAVGFLSVVTNVCGRPWGEDLPWRLQQPLHHPRHC